MVPAATNSVVGGQLTPNDVIAINPDGDLLSYPGYSRYGQAFGNGWDTFTALI